MFDIQQRELKEAARQSLEFIDGGASQDEICGLRWKAIKLSSRQSPH